MGASGIPKQAEWVVQVLLVNTKFERLKERETSVFSPVRARSAAKCSYIDESRKVLRQP